MQADDSSYASLNRRFDGKMKDVTVKTQVAEYQRTKAWHRDNVKGKDLTLARTLARCWHDP
jgi:hypothetical protein